MPPRPRREWHAPDVWTGVELQARIDALRGNATRLVDCSVCGTRMIANPLGGHATCLGLASPQTPLEGPRIAGDWIDGPVAARGRQRAADEAAAARAAELLKAAMPDRPAVPEPPPTILEPDVDTQRRIAKAMRDAPKCRICQKPILTADLDWSGSREREHFICAEAERQGVELADVVALTPHGRVNGRKGRNLADVIWETTVAESEKHWTDWAAAVADLEQESSE